MAKKYAPEEKKNSVSQSAKNGKGVKNNAKQLPGRRQLPQRPMIDSFGFYLSPFIGVKKIRDYFIYLNECTKDMNYLSEDFLDDRRFIVDSKEKYAEWAKPNMPLQWSEELKETIKSDLPRAQEIERKYCSM